MNAGPTYSYTESGPIPVPIGVAAVLDLNTRVWTKVQFAEPLAAAGGVPSSLCPVDIGTGVVVSTCAEMADPITPMTFTPETGPGALRPTGNAVWRGSDRVR